VPPHARAGQLRTRAPLRSLSPVFDGPEASADIIDEVAIMTGERPTILSVVGRAGAEAALFGAALYGLMEASDHADLPVRGWRCISLAVWFLLGAIPLPWKRTRPLVGTTSFLVPFVLTALISWAFGLPIELTWSDFLRALLGFQNIFLAIQLCVAAVCGQALTAQAAKWWGRRTRG
jgi:hypothetical protein